MRSQGTTIELHYWLNDGSHSMDAFVFNRCEREFLGVAKATAKLLGIEIKIETEPIEEGGIISFFKILADHKSEIIVSVFSGLLVSFISASLKTPIEKLATTTINLLFEDEGIRELRKEKEKSQLRLDIIRNNVEAERLKREARENAIKKEEI